MIDNAFSTLEDICLPNNEDYVRIDENTDFWVEEKTKVQDTAQYVLHPVKLCLSPGDFVMWDSRTIHCNHPPSRLSVENDAAKRLKRLVAYICMTPTSLAKDLDTLVEKKSTRF